MSIYRFIQVLGEDRDVEKFDLKNLVYTKAVIKESLRVMPVVPVIARYVDKEVKLSKLFYNILQIHKYIFYFH